MPDAAFTGYLKRGNVEGTIVGVLVEQPSGWNINIVGTRTATGGYTLTGALGDHTAFTGELKRGAAEGTIVGTLIEVPWGWTINILGTRAEDGGYTLTAELGDPPAGLRVPAIDGGAW